jgi:hypothetical protein
MKITLSLLVVVAATATGCATGPGMMNGGSTRSHGGGADVPVWVYDGYLSTGEEPIHRRANSNAPVIFKLDHDSETDLYKFPSDAVAFVSPTTEFACTAVNDTLVRCNRTGSAAGSFKYKISVVLRSDPTRRTTLDPFIITH